MLTQAQKPWEKAAKDWKIDDCLKITTNSPWAYTFSDLGVEMDTKTLNGKMMFGTVAPQIVLRVYSADIIRQSLARINELGSKYDQLSEPDKAKIDERNRSLRDCELCKKYYVFILMQPASADASENLVGNRMQNTKFEELKDKVYLTNDKNEKRELAQFVAPRSSKGFSVFYFERIDKNGKPLVSDETKKFSFIFNVGSLEGGIRYLMENKVTFDLTKMTVGQKLDL
jgi:hypothetical protein